MTDYPPLILGWKTNKDGHPSYWIKPQQQTYPAPPEAFVSVPLKSIAHHTAILAMSGSGKSYFLGRFIEEIITKTLCRCVVFDPNADFRRINEVSPEIYSSPRYEIDGTSAIPLPDESDGESFSIKWGNRRKRVYQFGSDKHYEYPAEGLGLRLKDISGNFLAADLPAQMGSEIGYVHDFLIEVASALDPTNPGLEIGGAGGNLEPVEVGERLFRLARKASEADFLKLSRAGLDNISQDRLRFLCNVPQYVSESSERAYFGRIRRLFSQNLVQVSQNGRYRKDPSALEIIDLPSIQNHQDQLLASHALLSFEWKRARSAWSKAIAEQQNEYVRIPTFLIIDEAHNLAPRNPSSNAGKMLLEQVRTIVAEGRKYGLFAVLVSQRPDKLDDIVLSECENVALMRLSNSSTLEEAIKLMNLNIDDAERQKILTMKKGLVRIFGKWTNEDRGETLFCAARRTVQGGADLKSEYWAKPPNYPPQDESLE